MGATDDRKKVIGDLAHKHGFEEGAVAAMASALEAGHGTMAQFNHPALGGMGQWSRGGMLMIGDMFNDGLKGRVAALAEDLSRALGEGRLGTRETAQSGREPAAGSSANWWPESLGVPSSSGGQNGSLYAVFPEHHRLAVKRDGEVTLYDTGEHRISGVSQQQGTNDNLSFGTASGSITVDRLRRVADGG